MKKILHAASVNVGQCGFANAKSIVTYFVSQVTSSVSQFVSDFNSSKLFACIDPSVIDWASPWLKKNMADQPSETALAILDDQGRRVVRLRQLSRPCWFVFTFVKLVHMEMENGQ